MKRAFTLLLLVLLTAALGFSQSNSPVDDAVSGRNEAAPIFIPNAFTPNDDGVNDVFYIPDANLSNFEFTVFDRWGNQTYQTVNPNFRWNGESKGRGVPEGTYVYLLVATNSKGATIKRSGHITVVR